jgi:hypothetical protein
MAAKSRLHSITSSARTSSGDGHVEAERLGGPEIDHELEFHDSIDRQLVRFGTFEQSIGL